MAFDEIRLPKRIELGAQGGPQFKTTVLQLASGHEKRNIDWAHTRGQWDIGYGIEDIDTLDEVIAFFYARQGMARGFRFRDWSDYRLGVAAAQPIGIGDGTNTLFQIYRRYTSGAVSFDRTISKPVSGTVQVFLDGVETTAFSVDTTTGLITMDSAPALGEEVSVSCDFDIPVRFATDMLAVRADWHDHASIPQIALIEVRV